ncbi:hypothetical protein CK203_014682 [Vitis vinifera]|uniref:Uncharacterized protein n=1 Tax=Vitis vinifera TaxID=29760 RepID=A0A438JGH6_VITVI|nr:hypothetical protein CK203_014682 [Vitis vinifera]
MQVTWSDSESCQSSEKESNASEECTNFTAFMASVIDEPLKKEALSESYKIAFLEGEHFDMKKMCDELKSENQVFKNELSLRKEESHPSSKRLSDLINLGRKSFDKRGLGFVDEATTPSSGNRSFFTNFTEFDGGNVTFGDGNVASVKGKAQFVLPDP